MMDDETPISSLAITVSRAIYELDRARPITAQDAMYVMTLAARSCNASRLVATGLQWSVDGEVIESPLGEFGSRLSATVEWLLVNDGQG